MFQVWIAVLCKINVLVPNRFPDVLYVIPHKTDKNAFSDWKTFIFNFSLI